MIDGLIAWLWWFAGTLVDAALLFWVAFCGAMVWVMVSEIWRKANRR